MDFLLGIDIGTNGTKSALFTTDGTLVDLSSCDYGLNYPREGWVEQDSGAWWNALLVTVSELVERNRCGGSIIGLSLSTQGGALVLLDGDFTPLGPAISWLDSRAKETEHLLIERISPERLYKICGWPVVSGLNFPTIFWLRKRMPDLYKKVRYFASTVDYINCLLSGRFAIDPTNLALTMFLDLEKRDVSDEILGIAGIPRSSLPEVVPSGRIIGRLRRDVAEKLGLTRDVVVISGAHDQYCANIGAGAIEVGDCVLSSGTAWALLATCDRLYFNEQTVSAGRIVHTVFPGLHPIEGKYGLMTSVPFGGNSLKWFRDVVRPSSPFKNLDKDAALIPPGAGGLLFLPVASTSSGRGAFIGIDGVHTVSHLTRAIMEGVAYANRRHIEIINASGLKIKNLVMIGGGTKSELWPRIVADVSGVPVFIPGIKEAACAGAAILAGVGSGVFKSIEEGSMCFVSEKRELVPDASLVEVYNRLYRDFLNAIDKV